MKDFFNKKWVRSALRSFVGGGLTTLVLLMYSVESFSELSWQVVGGAVLFSAVRTTIKYLDELIKGSE